jgi:cellulose synthase/poly-beta-1,6-N-acetylglucosamine synthase-like glycosyltransferase
MNVDIVIPVYSERIDALLATISACQHQTYPIGTVFVVDDASPQPVVLPAERLPLHQQIQLVRLAKNIGISGARNAALARSRTELVACVNTEVLPDRHWLQTCCEYLEQHPEVGACFTRTMPANPDRLLTRWRMRFQEPKYEECSGPAAFAHGHAVLFRRKAIDCVGGYDVKLRLHHEDSDICRRMKSQGWGTHYIAKSRCVSIQQDTLKSLAIKQLRDSGWFDFEARSLPRLILHLTRWTAVRAGRNVFKGRWYFIPVDFAIWFRSLSIAISQSLFSPTPRDLSVSEFSGGGKT